MNNPLHCKKRTNEWITVNKSECRGKLCLIDQFRS